MSNQRARFAVTLPLKALENVKAMVVGCGGIGGYAAILLAKMGVPNMVLIDHDEVEEVNVGTQIYSGDDVGKDKADVLASLCLDHSATGGFRPIVDVFQPEHMKLLIGNPFFRSTPRRNIVITALDNIEGRKQVWGEVYDHMPLGVVRNQLLFIDPRMMLEALEVNALPLPNREYKLAREAYNRRICDKEQKYIDEPCGEKAIPGTGMYAASVIMSVVLQWLLGNRFPHLVIGSLSSSTGDMFMKSYYPEGIQSKLENVSHPAPTHSEGMNWGGSA